MKKLLFDLFPIIVFYIAWKLGDSNAEATRAFMASVGLPQPTSTGEKPGIYLATLVAIVASFGQIGWVKLRGRKADKMLWISVGIILIFGGATLWLHDESFIKWKPTVLYWVFAGAIFGAAAFGRNVIKNVMGPQLELPDNVWTLMNFSWGGFFAFMGVANLFVAFNFSSDVWREYKMWGTLGLMLAFSTVQVIVLTKYLDKAGLNKEENQ